MEEKKIVYKSIDEQLAEDERISKAAPKAYDKPVERATTGPKRRRGKLRLKKSVRRTVGSLMLATSVVVAAIPTGTVQAVGPGDYYGSEAPAPKISPEVSDDSALPNDSEITGTSVSSSNPETDTVYAGFPLIVPEYDPVTHMPIETIDCGGYKFFLIDYEGYNNVDKDNPARPIYALDKNKSNIDFYFETIGGSDAYTPPGFELNLTIGTVNETKGIPTRWADEDHLYESEIIDFRDEGNKYDGKEYRSALNVRKISVYDKMKPVSVRFIGKDNTTVWEDSEHFYEKDHVTGYPASAEAPENYKFVKWNPDVTDASVLIPEGATEYVVTAVFEPKTSLTSTFSTAPSLLNKLLNPNDSSDEESINTVPATEPEEIDNVTINKYDSTDEGNDGTNNEFQTPTETTTVTNQESSEDTTNVKSPDLNNVTESTQNSTTKTISEPTLELVTESDSTSNQEDNNSNEVNEPEGDGLTVVEEEHLSQTADAGGVGLTGILLDIDFGGRKYKEPASQVYYVCDEVNPISNICNNVFENTKNVKYVELNSNMRKIGDSAFQGSGVESITFGNSMESIGHSSFRQCSSLKTVNYSVGIPVIGSKAFAGCTSLTSMSDDGSEVIKILNGVNQIGSGAFYETGMKELSFANAENCKLYNAVFAKNASLTKADLENPNNTSLDNSKLESSESLFAECPGLNEVTIPRGFSGKLESGVFGQCYGMNHIIFKGNGTFYDGEFDRRQITVEGPKPAKSDNYLNPSDNASKSFTSSMDGVNDYVYRYIDTDGIHEVVNYVAYTPNDGDDGMDFFKAEINPDGQKTGFTNNQKYVFDVNRNTSLLSGFYYRESSPCNLEIGNNIGPREGGIDGAIPLVGIKDALFKSDSMIKNLQLDDNIVYIGSNSFEKTSLQNLWANVNNGSQFGSQAFYDTSSLKRVTFSGNGEGDPSSKIESECFAKTPKLNNVDFYDDNLKDGKMSNFANFTSGTIASNAFYTEDRSEGDNFTFKGPMRSNYAPYDFARDPASQITNTQLFTKYYSGNPWNLTGQYKVEGFEKVNPFTGKSEKYSGFFLIQYPNMSSRMDKDDIDTDYSTDASSRVTGTDIFKKDPNTRTTMEQDCLTYTQNIHIPFGIQYVDTAVSNICKGCPTDSGDNPIYYKFSDSTNLYDTYNHDSYSVFKYNPSIVSVTFEAGSVSEYPDRMFEGARNLETVIFNNDVTHLGELPFYMPDTEADHNCSTYLPGSFPHSGPGTKYDEEDKSHIEMVQFNAESDGSSDNERYSSTDAAGAFNGLIKSNNGSRNLLVQLVPSRGDIFGSNVISSDELSGLDKYADYAARDCDALKTVLFPEDGCDISYGCFMDCDNLESVTMPNDVVKVDDKAFAGITTTMAVTFPSDDVQLENLPFEPGSRNGEQYPSVKFYVHDTAKILKKYADEHANIDWNLIPENITLTFLDQYDGSYKQVVSASAGAVAYSNLPAVLPTYQGKEPTDWVGTYDSSGESVNWKSTALNGSATFISRYNTSEVTVKFMVDGVLKKTVTLESGEILTEDKVPTVVVYDGRIFTGWAPDEVGEKITSNVTCVAQFYDPSTSSSSSTSTSSSSSSSSTTSSTSTTSTSSSTSTTSRSSSSSSSSSRSSSASSSSSSAKPVFINSTDGIAGASGALGPGVNSTVYVGDGSGSGGSSGSGSGSGGSGNATVISTTGGISDTGKISATVNGSSDNYIVKITQTQEADEAGLAALHNEYGDDISAIRYLPFDISLYDSTGTNKISPVPAGVSVSITMPIPDDLAIYGGNAKIASTAGGVLDRMTPRFTVINGVPCMTYTCTHFSPYMVWVDTANLTEAGIMDATPKTADGIHPKWFLCIGLAAFAVVLFLKKDPEEYLKKKAA